jgi:hypothetical protein
MEDGRLRPAVDVWLEMSPQAFESVTDGGREERIGDGQNGDTLEERGIADREDRARARGDEYLDESERETIALPQ